MAHDRFVNRLAGHDLQHGVAIGMDGGPFAVPGEADDFGFACGLAVDCHVTREHGDHAVVPGRQVQCDIGISVKTNIPQVDRCEGPRRSSGATKLTGNDAGFAALKLHDGDRIAGNGLIAGRAHLVGGWQVHPELDHAEQSTGFAVAGRVELLMKDAARCRHPLHVPGADDAAATGGIPMADFAVIDDRHGLEAAMGVLADATGMTACGLEVVGTGIVEQQERTDCRRIALITEQRAHGKAVSDPVSALRAHDLCDGFHGGSSHLVAPWLFRVPEHQGVAFASDQRCNAARSSSKYGP